MFNAEGRQAEEDKAGAEMGAGAGVGEVGGSGEIYTFFRRHKSRLPNVHSIAFEKILIFDCS